MCCDVARHEGFGKLQGVRGGGGTSEPSSSPFRTLLRLIEDAIFSGRAVQA